MLVISFSFTRFNRFEIFWSLTLSFRSSLLSCYFVIFSRPFGEFFLEVCVTKFRWENDSIRIIPDEDLFTWRVSFVFLYP